MQSFDAASFVATTAGRWDGWLLTAGSTLQTTTDGGRHWRTLTTAPALNDVDLVTENFGVGWNGPHNNRLALWETTDRGDRWTPIRLPAALAAGDVSNQMPVHASFVSPRIGWLLANNTTWHTSDGGRSWQIATDNTLH